MNYPMIAIGAAALVFAVGLFIYSRFYASKFSNPAEEAGASMLGGFGVLAFAVLMVLLGLFGVGL